jgi:choline kinase
MRQIGTRNERGAERVKRHDVRREGRQAVILAAGEGTRLRSSDDAPPKPLTQVAGLTLLERAVRTCVQAGVSDIVVVVGHRSSELVAALAELRQRYSVRLRPAFAADWQKGNGASALAAEPYVRGPFYLLMCDHLVDPRFLGTLTGADPASPCTLIIDREPGRVPDLPEATKVRLLGRRIVAIAKGLAKFDGVDTGVFLLRPAIFDALRSAAARGQHSLSAGIQLLADEGAAQVVECGALEWMDIDTLTDLKRAERRLARRARRDLRRALHVGADGLVPGRLLTEAAE